MSGIVSLTFLEALFTEAIEELITTQSDINSSHLLDAKNRFQQWVQLNVGPIISKYSTIKEDGPAHAKEFTVQVYVNGKVYGKGTGRSKKDAEKRAAEEALKKIGIDGNL